MLRPRRPRTLAAAIIAAVLALVLVSLGAFTLVALHRSGETTRDAAEREATRAARAGAAEVDGLVRERLATARALASFASAARGSRREDLVAVLRRAAADDRTLFGAWMVFTPGRAPGADAAHRGGPGSDPAGRFSPFWAREDGGLTLVAPDDVRGEYDEGYFTAPRDRRAAVAIEPYRDESVGVLMTSFAAPIVRDGRFLGVAGVDASLEDLSASVAGTRLLGAGYALVVTPAGAVIGGPGDLATSTPALMELPHADRTALAGIAGGKATRMTAADPLTGRPALLVAEPVGGSGWTYLAVLPLSAVEAPTRDLRTDLLLMALASLALTALGTWAIVRRRTRPLRELSDAASRLALGDLDVEVPHGRRDETGALADSFRAVADHLRDHANAARRVATGDLTVRPRTRSPEDVLGAALGEMVDGLRDITGHLQERSTRLGETGADVAASSATTREAVLETVATMEGIDVAMASQTEVAGAARAAADAAARAAAAAGERADEGAAIASRTTSAVEEMADTSRAMREAILGVGATSERIGEIIATVQEIATTTGILALNAAIEAARAGRSGSGFAVVADQIAGLAHSVEASVDTVTGLVDGIRDQVSAAVRLSEQGAAASDEGLDALRRMQEAFDAIHRGVAHAGERVATLADATGQVATSADETGATGRRAVARVTDAGRAAADLAGAAERLQDDAAALRGIVRRFTLPG